LFDFSFPGQLSQLESCLFLKMKNTDTNHRQKLNPVTSH
jgi:hypothetical protein